MMVLLEMGVLVNLDFLYQDSVSPLMIRKEVVVVLISLLMKRKAVVDLISLLMKKKEVVQHQ